MRARIAGQLVPVRPLTVAGINAVIGYSGAGLAGDAEAIEPGLKSINTTGRVVAGALPLLYGMGEGIVAGATFQHDEHEAEGVARPAMGTRRSRLLEGVGLQVD